VIRRDGSRVVVAVDGRRRPRQLILDAAVFSRPLAERLRPGAWLRVDLRRKGEHAVQVLDE